VAPGSAGTDDHRLGAGPIAGIAIGAAAILVAAGALIYICGRQSRGERNQREEGRNSFAAPAAAMADTKYASSSPGHGSFRATTAYSTTPSHDPYGSAHPSPPLHQHQAVASPLQGSPGAHPTYTTYQSLGMLQSPTGPTGYYQGQPHTPPPHHPTPPVELPTSGDPGNSPIPPYTAARQNSWSAAETDYRPGGKGPL